MAVTTEDPRWTQIKSTILTLHAVMGSEPEAPSDTVRAILEAVMVILGAVTPNHRLWSETFKLLGTYHTALDRFAIVRAVLSILCDSATYSWRQRLYFAEVWVLTIPSANIHPASLALCTTYKYDAMRNTLTRIVNTLAPAVEIFSEIKPGAGVSFWKLQVNTNVAPSNILAVGTVMVMEGKQVHLQGLGKGWAIGGELEVMFCRDLINLGPDLTVFRYLGLSYCDAMTKAHDSVRVGFWIRETTLQTVSRQSGYKGIRSNIGYYYRGQLLRPSKGKWRTRTQKVGDALLVTNSLAHLSLLCGA